MLPWGMDRDLEKRDLAWQAYAYLRYMASLGVERVPVVSVPDTLERISTDLGDCRRCPLHHGRNSIVFGEGPPDARLMFVGEGPGQDEDIQGRPFVGATGKLLTDIIEKGLKVPRSACYIANVVKCRSPENRDPAPDEIAACRPFLVRQIEAIKPRVIVALGRVAANTLLGTEAPLARLRNRFHEFSGIPVMPTHHPAALLHDPGLKRPTWEDIKLVIRKLEETGGPDR